MEKANLHEIKARLSRYIRRVEAGETVIVCKRNVPVAEIRPIVPRHRKVPELGWAEGIYEIPADFNDIPAEDEAAWKGDEHDPLRKYDPAGMTAKK